MKVYSTLAGPKNNNAVMNDTTEPYLNLGRGPIPIVFSLQCGQEVAQLFVGQGTKIRIFVIHLVLRGCSKTFLSCDTDLVFSEIVTTDSPIVLVIHVVLI